MVIVELAQHAAISYLAKKMLPDIKFWQMEDIPIKLSKGRSQMAGE